MLKNTTYIFVALWLLIGAKSFGQDAVFSQYYASSSYLNPALIGAESGLTFMSNYRTQWKSINTPFVTNHISGIYPVYKTGFEDVHIGGIGLSVFNDRAGEGNFKTLGVNFSFAYNLYFGKKNLSVVTLAGQGGITQKRVDYTDLQWGEQYNSFVGFDVNSIPTESQFTNGTLFPDFAAGGVYYFNPQADLEKSRVSAYLGASVYHLNTPNESFVSGVISKLPLLYKGHAGLEYQVSHNIKVSPNVLYLAQNDRSHINTGLYVKYLLFEGEKGLLSNAELIGGAWYRFEDAFILSTGITTNAYTIGFSYDYNTSSLRTNTNGRGAYEISLALRKVKESKRKRFATPRI